MGASRGAGLLQKTQWRLVVLIEVFFLEERRLLCSVLSQSMAGVPSSDLCAPL